MSADDRALALARRQMERHPAVRRVDAVDALKGYASFEVDVDLGFGSRWLAVGRSPTGVAAVETVRFDFPAEFPDRACIPSLRPNFSRVFPHVMPWMTPDDRAVPCVVDGRVEEFVAARGMTAFVGQVVRWLTRAAEGTLIDPEQGWTPIRRDDCTAWAVADSDALRYLAGEAAGYAFLETSYHYGKMGAALPFTCEVKSRAKISFTEQIRGSEHFGRGAALVLWAASKAGVEAPVIDTYAPDAVETWADLERSATSYGIGRLDFVLNLLCNRSWPRNLLRAPVPVFLLVRRPCRIEGQESDIEIIPYLVWLAFRDGRPIRPPAAVEPLAQRDSITPKLLRRVSGTATGAAAWALLGAGSLGSKIALHRTRSGSAPSVVVDRAALGPHNAARHGLYPDPFGWVDYKADALVEVLGRLGAATVSETRSAAAVLPAIDSGRFGRNQFLLNTTASLVVREALVRRGGDATRGVEAVLYGRGRFGLLACEGAGRNPDAGELISLFYQQARANLELAAALFGHEGDLQRAIVGEGCGSLTMIMDDASLSLQAAAMTKAVGTWSLVPPTAGTLQLWRETGGELLRERTVAEAHERVVPDQEPDWRISVSPDVCRRMMDEIALQPGVETGGVLIGRTSAVSRSIYVVDVLPAPPDSVRRSDEFILGMEGLSEALSALAEETGGALYHVGTWHSHLGTSQPSGYDRSTARHLTSTTGVPLALLIRGTDGFSALMVTPAAPEEVR